MDYTVILRDTDGNDLFEMTVPPHTTYLEDYTATFNEAIRQGIDLSHVVFSCTTSEVDFSGVDLSYADLSNVEFNKCNFSGANLSHAKLYRAEFTNCITDGWKLPDRYANPPQGPFQIWKVVATRPKNDMFEVEDYYYRILLLEVPEEAERVVAVGKIDRVRVSKAVPVNLFRLNGSEIEGATFKVYSPQINTDVPYVKWQEYVASGFDGNFLKDCAAGINGFLTWQEAFDYAMDTFNVFIDSLD